MRSKKIRKTRITDYAQVKINKHTILNCQYRILDDSQTNYNHSFKTFFFNMQKFSNYSQNKKDGLIFFMVKLKTQMSLFVFVLPSLSRSPSDFY
jgi:hypothetical protein